MTFLFCWLFIRAFPRLQEANEEFITVWESGFPFLDRVTFPSTGAQHLSVCFPIEFSHSSANSSVHGPSETQAPWKYDHVFPDTRYYYLRPVCTRDSNKSCRVSSLIKCRCFYSFRPDVNRNRFTFAREKRW